MAQFKYLGNRKYFIRFQTGDNFVDSLCEFFEVNDLKSAIIINALGKCENATLAYFDDHKLKYKHKELEKSCEIINISGSINYTQKSDIRVHAHVSLSDEDFNVYGGHLINLTVGLTLEMFIQEVKVEIEAKRDNKTNLQLLEI